MATRIDGADREVGELLGSLCSELGVLRKRAERALGRWIDRGAGGVEPDWHEARDALARARDRLVEVVGALDAVEAAAAEDPADALESTRATPGR
ncbi:MAG: hypothetical protein AAF628_15185 [Planctomycetota bacterium]